MRNLLISAIVFLFPTAIGVEKPNTRCPGENTMEMRYCAGLSLQKSTSNLQRKIPKALFQQWQDAVRAVCANAYTPYKDGTIYPQLVVGCGDNLNQALLKELQPLNNQVDPGRTQ